MPFKNPLPKKHKIQRRKQCLGAELSYQQFNSNKMWRIEAIYLHPSLFPVLCKNNGDLFTSWMPFFTKPRQFVAFDGQVKDNRIIIHFS